MKGLENHIEKKIRSKKIEKTVKVKVKLPHVNKKTSSEKANFCSNVVFSLYFKTRAKKFHAAKPLALSVHCLFRRDQNHYSNLTSKLMKMYEQILKKDSAPIQFKFFECKKTMKSVYDQSLNDCKVNNPQWVCKNWITVIQLNKSWGASRGQDIIWYSLRVP